MTNILLVEDNTGDVMLVREALAAHHVENELHVMSNGEEALEFIEVMGEPEHEPCPDLMLLDLNLPKGDGATVLAAFRQHAACTTTPVIVVTSSNSPKDRSKVAALGVERYFRKPSDFDEFMKLGAMVKSVLGMQAEHG